MARSTALPSSRLVRAAQAERETLAREREQLMRRRETLADEISRIEMALTEVDERVDLLGRLAGEPTTEVRPLPAAGVGPRKESGSAAGQPGMTLLRGPEIREAAARALLTAPAGRGPVHYREILELLHSAGLAIAGKDEAAVLLSQISRSPVIKKVSGPGRYQLDHTAPDQLRRKLAGLHNELREITGAPAEASQLAQLRKRRSELIHETSIVERALEEALATLRPAAGSTDLAQTG